MVSPQLASWQSRNHYRCDDDVVYGVYENCGFSVSEDDDGLLFIFMLSPRDDNSFDDFEDAMTQEGGELAEGQVGDVEGYLAVFFDQSEGLISARTMNRLLDFVVEQARPCGFRAPNICVKCGARATKRSFVDGMVQPLCAECSAQNKQNRRAAANTARKSAPEPKMQEDERYARQYQPIVPDNSKYDDSYDEYAGMAPAHSDYDRSPQYGQDDDRGYERDYEPQRQQERQRSYEQFDPSPIAFNDEGEEDHRRMISDDPDEDYREIMGDENEHSATVSETHIDGSAGMGVLGALVGSLVGVIPYLIIAIGFNFKMAALCFPAGMLAVWCYTLLKGRKSMTYGMGVSIGFSAVISVITMFLGMVIPYMDENRNFGQAVSYLFEEQSTFFAFNTVFALLGSVFGALFMIVLMAKYVEDN